MQRTDDIEATETQNQNEDSATTATGSLRLTDLVFIFLLILFFFYNIDDHLSQPAQPATPVAISNQIKSKRKADHLPLGSIEKNMKKAYDALETISQNSKQRKQEQEDECALYGQLIASKLRKLSNLSRLTLINKIDNLIFQAQLNELSNATPTNNTPNTYSNLYVVTSEDQSEYLYSGPSSVQSVAATSAIDDSSNSIADYYTQATTTLNLQ